MFSTPVALTLDNQPIGLGTVQLLNGEKGSGLGSIEGEYFMASPSRYDWISIICHRYIGKAMIWKPQKIGYRVSSKVALWPGAARVWNAGKSIGTGSRRLAASDRTRRAKARLYGIRA
jgi:hypothetical protein